MDQAESVIAEAVRVIARGGVIGFPTDTVYGLGCSPLDPTAIQKIYALKQRDRQKPLILLLGTLTELESYLPVGEALPLAIARRFLPGPLTLVVKRPSFVDPAVVAGGRSVGLRVPDDAFCQALLRATGALATTSANFSGGLPYLGVEERVVPVVDFFIDRGPTRLAQASSVLDCRIDPPQFLREGALTARRFAEWYEMWLSQQGNDGKGSE